MRAKIGLCVRTLVFGAAVLLAPVAAAESARAAKPATARSAHGTASRGQPKIVLDQLDLSKTDLGRPEEKFLRDVLGREARRADWGAGRKSRIQYRFRVDELEVTEEASVVKIRCAATGWLPKGKTAKSKLSFGGAPKERADLVRRVLAIVARGVVTRLAELERQRRLQSR
jgi:hypothetical protein